MLRHRDVADGDAGPELNSVRIADARRFHDRIDAVSEVEDIGIEASIPLEGIVAGSPGDRVIAVAAANHVISGQSSGHLGGGATGQSRVITCRPDNRREE